MQTIKTPSKKSVINRIYRASMLSAGKFTDQSWQGVSEVLSQINAALASFNCGLNLNVSIENGGYRENDGTKWKEYRLNVEKEDGSEFIGGILYAHAAGTISNPFGSYDISVVLW